MYPGIRSQGTRSQFLLMAVMMMTAAVMAGQAERETDAGCRQTRRQRRTEQLQHQQQSNTDNSVTNSTSLSSSYAGDGGTSVDQRPKHRLIRGSKKAFTITKREYLKTDWCKTEPFQQIIHVDGCRRTRILNRFCYGQCNSFYIPKSQPEVVGHGDNDGDSAHFRSCAICAPKKTDWATVVLRCPRLLPPFRRRRVRIVRHCKCLAVRIRR